MAFFEIGNRDRFKNVSLWISLSRSKKAYQLERIKKENIHNIDSISGLRGSYNVGANERSKRIYR